MAPSASENACTVSEQLPALRVQFPRLVDPAEKLTLPVGVTPEEEVSVIVTLITVEPDSPMLEGVAVTAAAVESAVTVTEADPVEPRKLEDDPVNVAVIEFAPNASADPCTVMEHEPEVSVQLPKLVLPKVNATVPAGVELGADVLLTVAFKLVELE